MKKIFISIFLLSFIFYFANAEEVKKDKKNENITEEQLIAEFMKSDKKSKEVKNNLEESKKMGKTLDELNKQLEKDKK
ncbi:hypothetical protein NG764_08910 [Aliarcobacter cryaerophilus]|jgi:uncharacterized membrane protein YhiD involved in acid resistance|uniref:hypothetical protein n=1 Tax=Aliarcobacter cryaerophilus TaxID=28198 RepID=UPI003DA6B7A2